MGLFDKLKDQALNSINELGGIQKETVNNEQNQQAPMAPPPPPQAPVVQSPTPQVAEKGDDGIYGNYMEHLIEMALADGELTEKEKQVLFKKAEANGIDLDEFEMVLDARLYEKQKSMKASQPVATGAAPKSEKYGDVRKCPGCGAIIESFTTRCPDCGFVFNNVGAISSVTAFSKKMDQIEASRSGSLLSGIAAMYGMDKITQQKSTLIANFPIPTSKEDILEFLTLAVPQAKDMGFLEAMKGNVTQEQKMLKPVWKRKCEQIIMKARLSMKDDKATMEEIERFAKELKIK
jgi:hypothetical protein